MDRGGNIAVQSPSLKSAFPRNVLQPSTKHNIPSQKPSPGKNGQKKLVGSVSHPVIGQQLIEDDQWAERTSIITKQDHENNILYAGQFIQEMLDHLPINSIGGDNLNKTGNEDVSKSVTNAGEMNAGDSNINSPVVTSNKMYSYQLDDLDENVDPFQTKTKVMDSPCHPPRYGEGDNKREGNSVETPVLNDIADVMASLSLDCKGPEMKVATNENNSFTLSKSLLEEIGGSVSTSPNVHPEITVEVEKTSSDECLDDAVPKASGYDIDFDRLDEFNPFETNKQLCNSPVQKESRVHAGQEEITNCTANDCLITSDNENPKIKENGESGNKDVEIPKADYTIDFDHLNENADPFKTNRQIMNSPVAGKQEKIAAYADHQNNSALDEPEKNETGEGFTTKVLSPGLEMHIGADNSTSGFTIDLDEVDENVDPFKTKSQIPNSPVIEVPKGTYSLNFDELDENSDPFTAKKQICNSPVATSKPEVKHESSTAESKTCEIVANSSDPSKTESQITDASLKMSPAISPEVDDDPFYTKSLVVNSPLSTDSGLIQDSKPEGNSDPPLETVKTANSPPTCPKRLEDNENPCKSQSMVSNSPPKSPKHVHFEDIGDPFKTKSQVANSPPLRKSQSAGQDMEIVDTFKPKSQIMNSPSKEMKSPTPKKSKRSPEPKEKPRWHSPSSFSVSPNRTSTKSPPRKVMSDCVSSPAKSPRKCLYSPSRSPVGGKPGSASRSPPGRSSPGPSKDKGKEATPPPPIRGRRKVGGETEGTSSSKDTSLREDSETNPFNETKLDQTVVDSTCMSHRVEGELTMKSMLDEQAEFGQEFSDNEFVPASEMFNNQAFSDPSAWDFLEKAGSGEDKESELARMSLYVKFDPLVKPPKPLTKTSPESHRFSILGNRPAMQAIIESDENLLGTPPAHKAQSRLPKKDTVTEKVRPDLMGEVDQIFSCNSMADQPTNTEAGNLLPPTDPAGDLVQVLQYSEADMQRVRTELELGYQSDILIKEKQWHAKYLELSKENQREVTALQAQLEEMRKRDAEKENRLQEIKLVMTDYEKTISEVLAEKEKGSQVSQKSMQEAIEAKEKALEEAASVEKMFSHLHSRYEQIKVFVSKQNENEATLKKALAEQKAMFEKLNISYKALKQQAEEKLRLASEELKKSQKTSVCDTAKLQAQLKKKELQIEGLEKSMQQKIEENQELTKICDELISKVGM